MKAIAFITAALIFLMLTTRGPSYFNQLAPAEQQNVFAYSNNLLADNIQMKPLSRINEVDNRETEVKLKLMDYNIHRGIGKNGKLDLNAVAEVMIASNADVIALQEVERYSIRTGFQDQIKRLADKTGMNYVFNKSINILNGEYGNGLLSRYPIEEYKAFDLTSFGEQRTVLRAVINVDGLKLAVYNTHLGLKESEREEQLNFIIELISEEKLAYILMGDMNSKDDKLKGITDIMKDSAQDRNKQQLNTFEEKDMQGRIDYIFVQPDMEVSDYEVIKSDASDHYPVVSDIVVNK